MTLEDDARKCCADIENVRHHTQRLKERCADDAKKDLSTLEAKLDRFLAEAKDVRNKLDSGMREGLEALVTRLRGAHARLRAHLQLIEAKSVLASARRLAADQYYVAAENELTVALRLVNEACDLLPGADAHVTDLVREIEHAVQDIHAKADTAAATLERVVACNERLLAEIAQAA